MLYFFTTKIGITRSEKMKLISLIVNLCIFKLCVSAPREIQSHRTTVDDHVVSKRGIGLKNESELWPNINGRVIVPWKGSQNLGEKLKIENLNLVNNENLKYFRG